jgi:hypothetical protein
MGIVTNPYGEAGSLTPSNVNTSLPSWLQPSMPSYGG